MHPRTLGIAAILLSACGGQSSQPAEAPEPAPTPSAAPAPTEEPAPVEEPAPAEEPEPETAETPGPETPNRPPPPPPGSPLAELMKAHFKETAVIRAAVINGHITDAVTPAMALADMTGVDKLPVDYRRSITELKAASKRIGKSPDVPETAAATADIGVACGGCHSKVGGPKIQVGEPPPQGTTLPEIMKRHAWATERLWEGIFVPSDKAWKAGAAALQGETFPKDMLKPGGVHARSAAQRFSGLVAKAGDQKTATERAQMYAALLETCSSCHSAFGGK